MSLIRRARWGLAFGALLALGACSSGQPQVDKLQSAQLRVEFAQCLQLPVGAVELEVDSDRRVIHMKWVDNVGDGPVRSMEECLRQLGLEMFEY